jgi:hypothetical protein
MTKRTSTVDGQPRFGDGTWGDKPQSGPEFSLAVPVDAASVQAWLDRNNLPLSVGAAEELLDRINAGTEDNDLTRTDLYREVYREDTGHNVQDLRDFTVAQQLLRERGFAHFADGVDRYIAGLVSRARDYEGGFRASPPAPAAEPAVVHPANYLPVTNRQVQEGLPIDVVVAADGTVFYKSGEDAQPRRPRQIRLLTSHPLSDKDMDRLTGLLDYAYVVSTQERPGNLQDPERDTPYSFVVETTGRELKGDWFEQNLEQYVEYGTPERGTNQAGPGTAGTRLVSGFGDHLEVTVYYDDIH